MRWSWLGWIGAMCASGCFNPDGGADGETETATATDSAATQTSATQSDSATQGGTTQPTTTATGTSDPTSESTSTDGSGTTDETETTEAGPSCEGVDGSLDSACDEPTPYCLQGSCVACGALPEDPCSGTSPVCDDDSGGCVACTEHAQCPETACRVTTGACFPASNRVWVDASADCDAGNGSETNPYCEVTDAFDLVQSQPGNDPWTIRIAGSDTPYEGQTSWSQAKPLALIGPASGISAQLSATSGTAIGTSQEVYVSNIVVDATGSTGVYVGGGGRAYLHDVEVRGGGSTTGLRVFDGEIHTLRTTIRNADRGGLVEPDGALFLDESLIDNNLGGLLVQGQAFLRRSGVTGSYVAGGIDVEGGSVVMENSFTRGNIYDFGGLRVQTDGEATILYSTLIDGFYGGLVCFEAAGAVVVRNSIVVEANCPSATIDHSAVSEGVDQGSGNVSITVDDVPDIFASGQGPHVVPGSLVEGVASWLEGDPAFDFDGEPRPTEDGASDYAGADVP